MSSPKQKPRLPDGRMLKSDDGSLDLRAEQHAGRTVVPQIQRIPGVGNVRQFGSEY